MKHNFIKESFHTKHMAKHVDVDTNPERPKRKRAVKPTVKKIPYNEPVIQYIPNNVVTDDDPTPIKLIKSTYNPEAELFEELVDNIRRAIRLTVDYQKSINDSDPVTIKKHTNLAIKKLIRISQWA